MNFLAIPGSLFSQTLSSNSVSQLLQTHLAFFKERTENIGVDITAPVVPCLIRTRAAASYETAYGFLNQFCRVAWVRDVWLGDMMNGILSILYSYGRIPETE
jgi:hypothetical protein